MENNINDAREHRSYIKPEAELLVLRLEENIALSWGIFFDDEFNGEDDVFGAAGEGVSHEDEFDGEDDVFA